MKVKKNMWSSIEEDLPYFLRPHGQSKQISVAEKSPTLEGLLSIDMTCDESGPHKGRCLFSML